MTLHDRVPTFSLVLINNSQGGRVASRLSETPMPSNRIHRVAALASGDYSAIVIVGDATHFEDVTVRNGEAKLIKVGTARSAAAAVRVTDATGQPVPGAILRIAGAWHTIYPAANTPGMIAVADATGSACLEHLPTSVSALQVEARGFELFSVPVSLVGGQTADLGVVSLSPARGAITVQVVNMESGARYRVGCIAPGDAAGAKPESLPDDGEVVFTALPCRACTIFLVPFDGGPVVSETVILTAQRPDQTRVLDAAKLRQPPAATFK